MKRNVIAAKEREIRTIGDLGLCLLFRFLEIAIDAVRERETEEEEEGFTILNTLKCVVGVISSDPLHQRLPWEVLRLYVPFEKDRLNGAR